MKDDEIDMSIFNDETTGAENSNKTQQEEEVAKSAEKGIFQNIGINKRKHIKYGGASGDDDSELKAKLMKCLDSEPDSCDAFGTHVGKTLKNFNDINQEFVKVEIQKVLAISRLHQEHGEKMPVFTSE